MSLTAFLQLCAGLYIIVIFIELVMRRHLKHFILEFAIVIAVGSLAILVALTSNARIPFGEISSIYVLGLMLVSTVFGIAARYIFYVEAGKFSWLDFLKPLVITPLVLLPLIGSLQWDGKLNTMQTVSFAVLAFQNGFFWQNVLEGAKPAMQNASPVMPRQGK